jgi:hypothetical protein
MKICNTICHAKLYRQNFKNWTSGNNDIDKLIQVTQLSEHNVIVVQKSLEWIVPYDGFYNIEYNTKGGFGKVYKANWIDGPIERWNDKNGNWVVLSY